MGLPNIVSRNSTQQILGVTAEGRVTAAATGLYTVPAGKTSKILSITGILDAVGGDATYAVAILRSGSYRPVGAMVAVGPASLFIGQLVLVAGDIVTNIGDSGSTNGTMDMTVTYIEL